jgi:hypothetical protein
MRSLHREMKMIAHQNETKYCTAEAIPRMLRDVRFSFFRFDLVKNFAAKLPEYTVKGISHPCSTREGREVIACPQRFPARCAT